MVVVTVDGISPPTFAETNVAGTPRNKWQTLQDCRNKSGNDSKFTKLEIEPVKNIQEDRNKNFQGDRNEQKTFNFVLFGGGGIFRRFYNKNA